MKNMKCEYCKNESRFKMYGEYFCENHFIGIYDIQVINDIEVIEEEEILIFPNL